MQNGRYFGGVCDSQKGEREGATEAREVTDCSTTKIQDVMFLAVFTLINHTKPSGYYTDHQV
jgi:hypothetical protein